MRVSFIFIALTASVASASNFVARQATFPQCSFPCIGSADLGGCAITDNSCLCTNQAYVATTTTCIQAACTDPTDLQQALDSSVALCKAAGVDLPAIASSAVSSLSMLSTATGSVAPTNTAPSSTTTTATTNAGSKDGVAQGALLAFAGAAALALSL